MQTPSALRALRLVTRLAVEDVSDASYELFKMIMAPDDLTDQHWEAARLAAHGAFQPNVEKLYPLVGEPKEILKFLDYHLGLQGEGEDHRLSIEIATDAIPSGSKGNQTRPPALTVECVKKFKCARPSFVRGVRSVMHPGNPFGIRDAIAGLITLMSSQWFNSPAPIMEPEEMSEFCEDLAQFLIDRALHTPNTQKRGVTILFEMLRSPEWRKHTAPRLWSMFAYSTRVDEARESVRWCLQNAIELLEFMRGLPHGEGLKWWYGALWFHYDKLDTTARDEVERIARDMSLGDGLSDLNLYLNLIGQEVVRIRQEVDGFREKYGTERAGVELRSKLIALEGSQHRLARITAGRQ